ncbi:MAG: beta-propeller domain-containing protein [Gudongella sp.]|jgi:uncharacterized secreted protein with C-terminal beta-propeller domain|nr:beta-propeller domain-containing protein [Gudongella sp.]
MKKLMVMLIAITVLLLSSFAGAQNEPDVIALHIGSPLILFGDSTKPLDSDNPNVVPVIFMDRTLVPLRAISEHFGAEVTYDEKSREATVKYDGKQYAFPIGKNFVRIEEPGKQDKTVAYDTETKIIEGRTMVPLRFIAETILDRKVEYRDKVITIGNDIEPITDELLSDVKTRIAQALKPATDKELIALMSSNDFPVYFTTIVEDLAADKRAEQEMAAPSEGKSDYYQTNEQVEGVNEADLVKTDGTFIYVATGKSLRVYDSNNGKPKLTDELTAEIDSLTGQITEFSELYIHNGRLIIIGAKSGIDNWIRPLPEKFTEMSIMPVPKNDRYAYAAVYKVSDSGKLTLEREFEIEGDLLSSRKIDNVLYLIVNKYQYRYGVVEGPLTPVLRDTAKSEAYAELPISNVMYFPGKTSNNFLSIAAIDIEDNKAPASVEAFLGSGNTVYMSNNSLYIAAQGYHQTFGTITNIAKFNIDGLKIGFAGGGMVEGSLLNQFSMDEYKGNLRIAATNWQRESINSIYILNKDLKVTGKIGNIAPGETIHSARFIGDYGYLVTFRQIDPLFVLDLSDPDNPVITGELKVPGFSSYLHPVSNDVLLGIGRDVDEKTGIQGGIKLSTFDVSNKGMPREIASTIVGGQGSYADVLHDHRALMLNLKENIIAFDASLSEVSDKYVKTSFNGAVITNVASDGKIEVQKLISNEGVYGNHTRRIIYIGDKLYYILDENIRVFDFHDFREIK